MKSNLKFLFWPTVAGLLLAGCGDTALSEDMYSQKNSEIYVDDQTDLIFGADAQVVELRFGANFWWDVEAEPQNQTGDFETEDWFTISPTDNFGQRPVTVQLTRNIEKHDRSVLLRFRAQHSDEVVKTLTLTQEATEPFLEVDTYSRDFSILGGTFDVVLNTSDNWQVDVPDWCELADPLLAQGGKGKQIVVPFSVPLSRGEDHEGEIVFRSRDNEMILARVKVVQSGTFVVPVPVVTNSERLQVAWTKPYGALRFTINFYDPDDVLVASADYTPGQDETECIADVSGVDWNGYVGNFTATLQTYLSEDFFEEGEPSLTPVHNLFGEGSGDGSAAGPYRIGNTRHLQNINRTLAAGKHYLQTADIDLSGFVNNTYVAIGNAASPFTGVYNGGNHTISGLYHRPKNSETSGDMAGLGLFGYVSGNGTRIADLNLSEFDIEAGNTQAGPALIAYGLLAGVVGGDAKIAGCRIVNCKFRDNWSGSKQGNFAYGGIAGVLQDDACVTDCVIESVNFQYGYAGMFGQVVGLCRGASTVSRSVNIGGEVPDGGTGNNSPYVGGIVGQMGFVAGDAPLVTGCTNYGRVKTGQHSGGVVGRMIQESVVENCANYGTIWGNISAAKSFFGGVVGNTDAKTVVRNCFNAGSVTNRMGNNTNIVTLGGILGQWNCRVENCYNVGEVSATRTADNIKCEGLRLGGMFGNCNNQNAAVAVNVYSTGSVTGVGSSQVGAALGGSGLTLGQKLNNYILTSCYYLSGTASVALGDGNTKTGISELTASQMKTQGSYDGWDFGSVWAISTSVNNGYPTLQNVPEVTKP